MADLGWLTARPIAHRGLHDADRGTIENSESAVSAAIERGYAVEVDLQWTGGGEAVVHHDSTLDRLTDMTGPLSKLPLEELRRVTYSGTADRIQTLPELLEQVSGRVPLFLELKSQWQGDTALARRTIECARGYQGPLAVMSFDPALIAAIRRQAPEIVRGIVSCRYGSPGEWPQLSAGRRMGLRYFAHVLQTRPRFVSYDIRGLRAAVPRVLRATGMPIITWTVRTQEDAAFAANWADQITFEGFCPDIDEE